MYQDNWKKASAGHHSTGHHSRGHHSRGHHSAGHHSGGHHSSAHHSAGHHSVDHHSHAHRQKMTNKHADYRALEHHYGHSAVSRSLPGNPQPDKTINITLVPKKVAKKPEHCLKPFSDSKNNDKTKVFEILPKPMAASESPALNIRSGISPLIYCKQSSEGKQSGGATESDKSSSLEKKVNPASIIISQRNCVVQRRREERQSFEDKILEVEEKRAHDKKKVKKGSGHFNRSDSLSGTENVIENACQHNIETGKTSKHEKHLEVYKSAMTKHTSSKHRDYVENKGVRMGKRVDVIGTSQTDDTSTSLVKQHRHDTKLNQGLKATIVCKGSGKNKHSYLMDKASDMNSKSSEKMSGKHMSKSVPLDYGNLYLYCIRKSYRLKHCNWNQSSETLLRMLKKKYKSLKLMIPNKPVLYLARCPVNTCKEIVKEADTEEQTTHSKLPIEEGSERNSATSGDDLKEEGSLVDPRVMSLSKTLVSSNNGTVGQDKTFKKHTPIVHHKSSQKSHTQLHKKHSKPDWSRLKEKLKAISSKPVKKVNDDVVVEKNSIKIPMHLGNLFINQVPQFKIPKKSSSTSKTDKYELKSDSETFSKNMLDTTVNEADKDPNADMQEEVPIDSNDSNAVLDELNDSTGVKFSENIFTMKSDEMLPSAAKPGDKPDYATPDELIKDDKSYRDDEDNFDEVPMELTEETIECIEVTEGFDLIPDLYAEKAETVMKDDTACDTSPPVLEKAIDTSPFNNQNDEQSNYTELDNDMLVCYGNISATKGQEFENCKHVSADDRYETLPVHTCNTAQQQAYSNFEIFENSEDSDDTSDTDDLMQNKDVLHNEGDEELPVDIFDDVVFEGSVIDNVGYTDANESAIVDIVCSIVDNEVSVVSNEDCIDDIEVSGVNKEFSVVCNEGAVVDNEGYILENEGSVIDNKGYAVDNEVSVNDNEVPIDNEVYVVESEGYTVGYEGSEVDNESPAIDNESYTVLTEGSVNDNEGYIVRNEGSVIENEGYNVENEGVVDNEGSVVDNELPAVDNELPVVDNELPVVDNELSVVDNEGSVVLVIRDVYSMNEDNNKVLSITNDEEDAIDGVESIEHSAASLDTSPSQSFVSTTVPDENENHHEDEITGLNSKSDKLCVPLFDSMCDDDSADHVYSAGAVDGSSVDNVTGESDVSDCPTLDISVEKQPVSLDQNKLDTEEINEINTEESNELNSEEKNKLSTDECNEVKLEENTVLNTEDINELNTKETNEFSIEERNECNIAEQIELNIEERIELNTEERNELNTEDNSEFNMKENSEFFIEENNDLNTEENSEFNTAENNELNTAERIKLNTEERNELNTEENCEFNIAENSDFIIEENNVLDTEEDGEFKIAEQIELDTEKRSELNTEKYNELNTEENGEFNIAENNDFIMEENNDLDTEENCEFNIVENSEFINEENNEFNTAEINVPNTEGKNGLNTERKNEFNTAKNNELNSEENNEHNAGRNNEVDTERKNELNIEESNEFNTERGNELNTAENNRLNSEENSEFNTKENNEFTGNIEENNELNTEECAEQSNKKQQQDYVEPVNGNDGEIDDNDKHCAGNTTEDVNSDKTSNGNNETVDNIHVEDSEVTCLESDNGLVVECSHIDEIVDSFVSEEHDIACLESDNGLVTETVDSIVSEDTDIACLESDNGLVTETVDSIVSEVTDMACLESDIDSADAFNDDKETQGSMVLDDTCVESDTSSAEQYFDNDVVVGVGHADGEEDDISDRNRCADGKSNVNEDIHSSLYEDITDSGNVLDDPDDSCSLPDIEPPTVQVIEHKVPLDVTIPFDDRVSPSNHTTPTDDATHQVESVAKSNAKSTTKSKTTKAVTANETANKSLTANERTVRLTTTNEQPDKQVTVNDKADMMEFSDERLVRDFPNHNWLFNKYNSSLSESSDEPNDKTTKKKRKDSWKKEKMNSADNLVEVPQKPDRLDCRLSDCLQGFKSDKTNIETNIKFGWNKKCYKRGLNAFGKSFHNKVNLINNVLDVDIKNKEKLASGTKKSKLHETKLVKDMAVEHIGVCKTFNTSTTVDKPTLTCSELACDVLNMHKKGGNEYRESETAIEVINQPAEAFEVQNKEMPMEVSDGNGNKVFEATTMFVESSKESSKDRFGGMEDAVDVSGEVQTILQEMSDNVVETSERNAQSTDKRTIKEVTSKHISYDIIKTGISAVEDISDVDDVDDAGDDDDCRLEIDESVNDLSLTHQVETIVLNDTHDVLETTVSSDNLTTPVTPSLSAPSVTIATEVSSTQTKQVTNTCEEKSLLDNNIIKTDNTEVNFRPRSKPPVQLVHPQVHKPLTDPDSSHQSSVQEVQGQHGTVYQGTEVQNTRPISVSWTSADSIPVLTTNVTSTRQLTTITPSVSSTNSSTNSNQTVCTRVISSASLQDGHVSSLSSHRTVTSTVLASTAVPLYGSGLVIPIQPFMQNINIGPNQNVLPNQQLVQNTILYNPASVRPFVQPNPQNIPNFTGKSLSPCLSTGIVHAAVQKPSLDLNQGHMLMAQSGSLPQQRGLNSQFFILPKTQVSPLHASQLVPSRAMVPTEPLLNPLTVQQIPFQTTTMTENYTTPLGKDRKMLMPSSKIMAEKTSSSTKDLALNNCTEPDGEDEVDDEIKKQMEELDAEIKRKEYEQEEMKRKKLELLDKMKQAKLASKPKHFNELYSSKMITDTKVIEDKCKLNESEANTCNRKRKYSGDLKDKPSDNKSVKTCKDVVLNSVSSDTSDDVCVQNPAVEVSSVNLGSKAHEELSVTVTDGVISITDNRIKDDSVADDSVLDLALSTNILVTDREVIGDNEVPDKAMLCDNDKSFHVPDDVHTDYTTSKEFIEDIRVVNPFTGEYDGSTVSKKANIQLNEKKQTVYTNELENEKSKKESLKRVENELRSSQDTDNEESSLCIDLGNERASEKDTNLYSLENNSDTALNLVTVNRHSSVSDDRLHDNIDQEYKSISSAPTSTKNSIYFTLASISSMTSSVSISTSSSNISSNSGLSLVSSCSSSTASENSGTSILPLSSITTSASIVEVTPQTAQLESKLPENKPTDHNSKVDKLSKSSDLRDADTGSIDGTVELTASTHKDAAVEIEEPLNLMKNSELGNSKHGKHVEDDKAIHGESVQCADSAVSKHDDEEVQDLSVCSNSSKRSNVPLSLEKADEKTVDKTIEKAVAHVPIPMSFEKVPVTQSEPKNPVREGDTNSVKQSNNKVMYIQDKPVSVQNINGALRLASPVNAVEPDKQSRSRDKYRKVKPKFIEIQPAHQRVPPPPKKSRNANPEPAHMVKVTSRDTLKKMNRGTKYRIPLSICQSSPHYRRLVPNYFSPREWTKALPKPWQKRQPKPAHIRRPFGIAGHLIVSSSRRRKRTFSEEHLPSPKFYSLPNTPTTPPSTPDRVSSASDVAADSRITYKRSQSESMELSTSPNIAQSEKNYAPDGAPIRAHCRPRSSANKEQFYETSVFRPPSIHKNIDNLATDKSDIIDLTSDVICVSESGQKKAAKKSTSTEKAIQEELNQAVSKRQRLDFEESSSKSQPRAMNKSGDSGSKTLSNRIDPELVRKTLMRPPPPYTGRQRMPVLAQFPRRLPFDQPRIANKNVSYPQVFSSENQMPVSTRMPFSPRGLGMDVPRVPNPLQMVTTGITMTQSTRWSQSPPYRHATVEPNFPSRPVHHDVCSPEFTGKGHGIRHAPVTGQSAHEYVTSHGSAETVMLRVPIQSAHRQPVYPSSNMVPAQPIRHQTTADTRFQQHGVVSPSGYPATSPGYPSSSPGYPPKSPGYPTTSPGYPSTSPGYPATSPVYPPKSPGYPSTPPGSNIASIQRTMHRHPNMVTQPNTNVALSVHQPQLSGQGYPNPPYPTQVHQLLQKPSAAHQTMVPGGQISQQMYPPMNPSVRNSHVTSRGDTGAHTSQSIAHTVAPRGYMAQGYNRDISKGQGQTYPTASQNPYTGINRGNAIRMALPGDVSAQMVGRGQLSPASTMLPRRSPGVTNVESNTTNRQRLVGQYPMQGNLSATQQHALEEQLRASRLAADDQARATQLAEEQQLQSMQRIRAQHIRAQQMQVRSPPGGVTTGTARFQDPTPIHQQHEGASQATHVINQETRGFKLQQQTLPTDLHQPTSAQLPVVDPSSLTDTRTGSTDSVQYPSVGPQGRHALLLSGSHARGQGHVTDYAQMNNETVMAQCGSQTVPNAHTNYTTAQEMSSVHSGSSGMRGRHSSNSGQFFKTELVPGFSGKGLSSPGNQVKGHVILPEGQGQTVQYSSANISNNNVPYKGQTVQVESHTRPADRDMSRQNYAVVVQGQGTPMLQQKSPTALTFSPQHSVHQSHVNITPNRHILPKPSRNGNNYTQNVTSQSVVTMPTDLSHPQLQQQQQTQFVSSAQLSPQMPSTDVQHSPQNLNSSTKGQSIEGRMDSELPHLQQVHGECILCGKYSLYLCSSCKQIWYCSPECQLTHWQTHAAECAGPI